MVRPSLIIMYFLNYSFVIQFNCISAEFSQTVWRFWYVDLAAMCSWWQNSIPFISSQKCLTSLKCVDSVLFSIQPPKLFPQFIHVLFHLLGLIGNQTMLPVLRRPAAASSNLKNHCICLNYCQCSIIGWLKALTRRALTTVTSVLLSRCPCWHHMGWIILSTQIEQSQLCSLTASLGWLWHHRVSNSLSPNERPNPLMSPFQIISLSSLLNIIKYLLHPQISVLQ